MGWTRPILGIRISPICTTGAGAVGFAGAAIGFVAWVAGAGGSVVVVVGGGIGRSANCWAAVETGESAAAAAPAELPWPRAVTTPVRRTTTMRRASTRTDGTRHRRRARAGPAGAVAPVRSVAGKSA